MGKRGRPSKADILAREPFDAEATISGEMVGAIAKESAFERVETAFKVVKHLREELDSGLFHMNYPVHAFKELSNEPGDWCVSYMFPIAQDEEGKTIPTYIDAPKTKRQLELCKKKANVMKKLGLRYMVFREEALIKNEEFSDELGLQLL